MNKRTLGRTDLSVGEIGVGCWAIGGPFANLGLAAGWDNPNDESAKDGLNAAALMGANLFDTADVYGFGHSERLIGEMVERFAREGIGPRDSFTLVSKVGYYRGDAPHGYDPTHMRHQLESSLVNLRTNYLDIYFFHHLDFGPSDGYLDGSVEAMRRFQKEGKIRYIGLRGPHKFSLLRASGEASLESKNDRFLRLAERINPDIISVRYNMLTPLATVVDILTWAKSKQLGILVYKPLAQGLLLDKYDPKNPPKFSHEDQRSRKAWFRAQALQALHERLLVIKERFGCQTAGDLARLAVGYCLTRCETACVVTGFRTAEQVREAFAVETSLNEGECSLIESTFEGLREELGHFFWLKGEMD